MATVWLERRDCVESNFPDVCLKCGRVTVRAQRVKEDFPGSFLSIDFTPGLFSRRLAPGRAPPKPCFPMCDKHRHHWQHRSTILGSALFAGVAVLVAGCGVLVFGSQELGWVIDAIGLALIVLVLVCLALTIPGVATFVLRQTGIRATEVSERGIILTGVSEQFADAYSEQHPMFVPADDHGCRPARGRAATGAGGAGALSARRGRRAIS
jgi:hypothetical protein